jgi:hypothetical protein
MGREVRRVPLDWRHPRKNGQFIPLYDQSVQDAWDEWIKEYTKWFEGGKPWIDTTREYFEPYRKFCEWENPPPNPKYYRPAWKPEIAIGFQLYENISEGTPVSPIFETEKALNEWMEKNEY